MAEIDNLNKAITDVQAENATVITTLGNVATQITTLQGQVATLQAALAAAGNNDPAIQAAADALEAGLPPIAAAIAAVTPAPAPAPTPDPTPTS